MTQFMNKILVNQWFYNFRWRNRLMRNYRVEIDSDRIRVMHKKRLLQQYNSNFEIKLVDSIDVYQIRPFVMVLTFNSKEGLLGKVNESMLGWETFKEKMLECFPNFNVDVFEWLKATHFHVERCWQRGVDNPYMENFTKYKNDILQNGFKRRELFKNKSLVCIKDNKIMIKHSHYVMHWKNFIFDINDVVTIEASLIEPFYKFLCFNSSKGVIGFVSEFTKGWVPFYNELSNYFPGFDYNVYDKMNGYVETVIRCWDRNNSVENVKHETN